MRQGCILSYSLFLVNIDFVTTKAIDDASFGNVCGQKRLADLDSADDMSTLIHTLAGITAKNLEIFGAKIGLRIHCERTKAMKMGSALCSPVPMFPGTYVSRYLCSQNLCSPVLMFSEPMFPGTDVPRTYVPWYLCSPIPMFPEPTFPGTYVPRFTANVL